MCELLRRDAARTERPILVGRAETHLAGRLDTFAADALGFAIGRALAPSTGRQLLADPSVTLIVDGASEIPESTQTALTADLRLHLSRPGVATVVLVGHGIADMLRLLPTATPVTRFVVRPLDDQECRDLASSVLNEGQNDAELDRILQAPDRQLFSTTVSRCFRVCVRGSTSRSVGGLAPRQGTLTYNSMGRTALIADR
jgi:hypothetical protein